MDYRKEEHSRAFYKAISKLDKKNHALISAVYLLTADRGLWSQIKAFVERNVINFDEFKAKNSTENGYALLCCAKDLYIGTRYITISDLADTELIEPIVFGLICDAMVIRRAGLEAFEKERKEGMK